MAAAPMIRICVRLGFYRHDPVGVHIGGSRVIPCWRLITACNDGPSRCLDRGARRLHPKPGAYLRSSDRRRVLMPCAEPSAGRHQPNLPDLARPGHRSQPLARTAEAPIS